MAVDLPAPSGPVRMLHARGRGECCHVFGGVYAPMQSFGVWLRSPHLLLRFMHRWRFGLVALTPLLVLPTCYRC